MSGTGRRALYIIYIKKNHLGVLYLATTDFDLSRSTSISTCLCDHVVLTPVVSLSLTPSLWKS